MSDLAVKCFMAANSLEDFDVAERIMFRYGLAQPFVEFAEKLEPLVVVENSPEDAFREGVEFVQSIFQGIHYHLTPDMEGSGFAAGIQLAMETVDGVIQAAVDGARMTDEEVAVEEQVRNQTMPELDPDAILATIAQFFGGRGREQTSR